MSLAKKETRVVAKRRVVCDACGGEVEDQSDLLLMRGIDALPEASIYRVHERCAKPFRRQRGGAWEVIPISSERAALLF